MHLFFVHSPITYSMARATIDALQLRAPVLIGARGVRGPDIDDYVDSDGQWSIDGSCQALRCLMDAVPDGAPIAIYVPHTMFLLGQLLRISKRVAKLCYLEEGLTSAENSLQGCFLRPVQSDLELLRQTMAKLGLLESAQIHPALLDGLNTMDVRPFDHQHPRYGGCFACSPDAFANMPQVTRLQLEKDATPRSTRLLSFYGLHNRIDDKAVIAQAYRDILNIFTEQAALQPPGHRLIVKLHPRDELLQPQWLRLTLQSLNASYADYCQQNQLNSNREPALLNFDHYYFFGPTAQAKYVAQCWGAERMTRLL